MRKETKKKKQANKGRTIKERINKDRKKIDEREKKDGMIKEIRMGRIKKKSNWEREREQEI